MVPSATTFTCADAAFSGAHVQTATNAVRVRKCLLKARSDFGRTSAASSRVGFLRMDYSGAGSPPIVTVTQFVDSAREICLRSGPRNLDWMVIVTFHATFRRCGDFPGSSDFPEAQPQIDRRPTKGSHFGASPPQGLVERKGQDETFPPASSKLANGATVSFRRSAGTTCFLPGAGLRRRYQALDFNHEPWHAFTNMDGL